MKIALAVFSCSRFSKFIPSIMSYEDNLPRAIWKDSFLHEDRFQNGLERIKHKFNRVIVTEPAQGLGHAFYQMYKEELIDYDYILHLEDDWVIQGKIPLYKIVDYMHKNNIMQTYLSSKKDLQTAEAINLEKRKWPNKFDCYYDNKRLGLIIRRRKGQNYGHLFPNTTPSIIRRDFFEHYLKSIDKYLEQGEEIFSLTRSPQRAWKCWLGNKPDLIDIKRARTEYKFAFLFQRDQIIIRHIGTNERNRAKGIKGKVPKSRQQNTPE